MTTFTQRFNLRRHILRHAHDTELWASYLPRLPLWVWGAGAGGVGLIGIAAVAATWLQRILSLLTGVALLFPAITLGRFAYFSRKRRAAVRQMVLDAVNWRGDEAVLDVGCGSGMLLNGAVQRLTTGTATGIDIWTDQSGSGSYDLLQRHARAEGVADRIRFEEVDACDMPFDDHSFDVVLSSWAIHHISLSRDAFDAVVSEIMRVVKPGGTIVVVDVAHFVEVLATRMETAGFSAELHTTTLNQKIVIGRKPIAR